MHTAQDAAKAHAFAVGPLTGNDDDLLETVKKVSTNKLMGGGDWGVNKCRHSSHCAANTAHGERGVRWAATTAVTRVLLWTGLQVGDHLRTEYRRVIEGWVLYNLYVRAESQRNGQRPMAVPIHELDQDVTETMAYAAGRFIDSQLIPFGETLNFRYRTTGLYSCIIYLLKIQKQNENIIKPYIDTTGQYYTVVS